MNGTTMSADIQPIIMPTWGLTMEEGKLVRWLVPEGAAVTPGMEIAEIETSKITNVLEAQAAGILRRQVITEGETRACGALIAVLAGADVAAEAIDALVDEMAATAEATTAVAKPAPRMLDLGDGRTLRVFQLGEGGVPALLLHGFGGDLDNWQFNQPVLAADRAVHVLDLPGHGESLKDIAAGDLADLAKTVLQGVAALGLTRVHLVGHSLGGAVALQIATTRPDQVVSLALLAPVGLGSAVDARYPVDFTAAKKARDLQKCLARLFADPGLMSREMVEQVARNKRLDGADAALAKIVAANFTAAAPEFDLAALAMPVTVIWGAQDAIIPATALARLPQGIATHLLPRIGHMPQLEAADQVNAILADHMRAAS